MEKENSVKKIIIESFHELTDIAKEIHNCKENRIVLTFTDHSDLLISPINLKVLNEIAQRENKLLILQIIQNPTGVRNSKLAGITVIDTPSLPVEGDWQEAQLNKDLKLKEPKPIVKIEDTPPKPSSFEEQVNNVLSKSTGERYVPHRKQVETPFLSIDQDIPLKTDNGISGKDFSSVPVSPPTSVENRKNISTTPRKGLFSKIREIDFKNKKTLRITIITVIAFFLIPALVFVIYNQIVPLVKIKIFVEAKSVSIEKIFVGDKNITEIDFDNLRIPIKTGEVSKGQSDTINPTGKAYKGDKAQGAVTITYLKGTSCSDATPKVTLGVGHTLTTDNKSFKTTTAVEIACNSMATVNVIAADIGEEFNIPASKPFTVANHPTNEVYGLNATAFTGGTKQEYTVLSQQDLDSAIERLSTTAIEVIKSELRESDSNWEIIENSIQSGVDKSSIKTDKKVGEEASIVNLDITIKGTATYYFTKNLNEGLTKLLREEANTKNLFENDRDIELVLGDRIEKNIVVNSDVADKIEITLKAESTVRPKIDKEAIENTLKSMSWKEGNEYILSFSYSEQKSEVAFSPSGYPEFLKRFPNRRGGVLVSIVELKTED